MMVEEGGVSGQADPESAIVDVARYQEAMSTIRTVMTASVSAATALAAATIAILGFAVEDNQNAGLAAIAAVPLLPMFAIFRGWQAYNEAAGNDARNSMNVDSWDESLAKTLSSKPGPVVLYSPLVAAAVILLVAYGFRSA